ncbi:MBL fold metallo-hydrolase [Saccharopolyspora rhizosphaerae]|uniref:MBL fold metallo-hydrolase n=1 Tax=Saccharopolyspora rhizosphaerae TaxID=2492662 RepID=A0A3R8QCW4_9PSEU|nr:MBL fold metallo-hydrolase [Saccharopolyspora rhizosphaerae]RRO18131.1 MBL fold metallo-hydrolase [Saccharopolyspora rhizosphaerae]
MSYSNTSPDRANPDRSAPERATLAEVGPGVHAWVQPDGTWWINNAGAVLTDEGTVLVDTCATAERTHRFLDAVRALDPAKSIRFAVNTHVHGDHTHGNALLPDSTVLIGHPATRDGILADTWLRETPPIWEPAPRWEITENRAPSVVLRDSLELHLGGRAIELHHPGFAAHTPGDVVAWVPDAAVLFSGDLLFHGVTPLVFMGSVEGALKSLEWLAGFRPTAVVPGHGPTLPGSALPRVLEDHARYYRFVLDTARKGRADGLSPLEAAQRCDLGEFANWPDAERLVLNLHRAYAEADDRDLDLTAAFTDAQTYHGGPLPTHV